ncbi:MAG TPA: glycosyltransferase [Lacipirellulaceae bacterium]|nr:glycosyltransferase [Lacipirellulaceae bacterium]
MKLHTASMAPGSSLGDERVGVIIPVFNRRTILLETLPSVLAQSLAPAQLVVVDDGSTDGTPAAAEAWLSRRRPPFPWKVIRARHVSAAAARNIGFAEMHPVPLMAFLDSDDHWPADFLARGVAALGQHPKAVAAVSDRRFIDAFGECVEEDDCRELTENPLNWFFAHGAGVASCTVMRSAAFRAAGGWSETQGPGEDALLFCELALRGPWAHMPGEPVSFHLGTARARREEHNLSQRIPDSHFQWARAYEQIYARICERRPLAPRAELHRALGMRWYWAGKQLFTLGRADEARECFRRAINWQPTMFRAWRRWATAGASRWSRALATPKGTSTRRAAG